MRTSAMTLSALAGGLLALSACSQQTQDRAAKTADSAGDDIATAAGKVGDKAKDAAADVSTDVGHSVTQGAHALSTAAEKAADNAGAALKSAGRKADDAGHRVEANAQGESVEKAKKD